MGQKTGEAVYKVRDVQGGDCDADGNAGCATRCLGRFSGALILSLMVRRLQSKLEPSGLRQSAVPQRAGVRRLSVAERTDGHRLKGHGRQQYLQHSLL